MKHSSHNSFIVAVVVIYAFVSTQLVFGSTETTETTENKEKIPLPQGCIESICGSVVSKCLLTQSCRCGPDPVKNNITCARDCFYCLDYLYTDCCSCVDVCRKDSPERVSLGQHSSVEDLPEPSPELFRMLMESAETSQGRWTTLSFPAHHTVIGLNKDLHFVRITPHPVSANGSIEATPEPIAINPTYDSNAKNDDVNCTVAFMKTCLSMNKCREDCMSLGATSYRWFHDGCCECVDSTCLNYGLHEGRCEQCPISKDMLHQRDENDEEIVIQTPDNRPIPPQIVVEDSPQKQQEMQQAEISSPSPPAPILPLFVPPATVHPSSEPLGQLHKADDNGLSDQMNV